MSLTPRLDRLDKNYLINGNFEYAQRGPTATLASFAYQTVDRWETGRNTANWISPTADIGSSTFPTGSTAKQYLVMEGEPTVKALSTNLTWQQKIESIFSRDLANQNVTLRFNYVADVAGGADSTYTITVYTADSADNFSSVTQVYTTQFNPSAPGSWETKVLNFTLPADAKNGVLIQWQWGNIDTGANRQTWFSDACLRLGTFDEDPGFTLSGRDLIEELKLCERYYEKSYDLDSPPGSINGIGVVTAAPERSASNGNALSGINFKTTKRAIPTVNIWTTTGIAGRARYSGSDLLVGVTLEGTNHATIVNATGGAWPAASNAAMLFHYDADAEL